MVVLGLGSDPEVLQNIATSHGTHRNSGKPTDRPFIAVAAIPVGDNAPVIVFGKMNDGQERILSLDPSLSSESIDSRLANYLEFVPFADLGNGAKASILRRKDFAMDEMDEIITNVLAGGQHYFPSEGQSRGIECPSFEGKGELVLYDQSGTDKEEFVISEEPDWMLMRKVYKNQYGHKLSEFAASTSSSEEYGERLGPGMRCC